MNHTPATVPQVLEQPDYWNELLARVEADSWRIIKGDDDDVERPGKYLSEVVQKPVFKQFGWKERESWGQFLDELERLTPSWWESLWDGVDIRDNYIGLLAIHLLRAVGKVRLSHIWHIDDAAPGDPAYYRSEPWADFVARAEEEAKSILERDPDDVEKLEKLFHRIRQEAVDRKLKSMDGQSWSYFMSKVEGPRAQATAIDFNNNDSQLYLRLKLAVENAWQKRIHCSRADHGYPRDC